MTDETNNTHSDEHYVAPWANHRTGTQPWMAGLVFLLLACAVFLVVIVAS